MVELIVLANFWMWAGSIVGIALILASKYELVEESSEFLEGLADRNPIRYGLLKLYSRATVLSLPIYYLMEVIR